MRSFLLALLVFPSLAAAQLPNTVLDIAGLQFDALATTSFGAQLENEVPFGPYPLVQAIHAGEASDSLDGCEPFVNAEEVAGGVALVERGTCLFTVKATNAAAAGAVAMIVYQDDRNRPEDTTLVRMEGACTAEICSAPALFIARSTYNSILDLPDTDLEVVMTPELSPSVGVVSTGFSSLPVYDHGFFGTTPENGYAPVADESPFTYNGFNPLSVGTVLVAVGDDVAGSPYAPVSDFVRTSIVTPADGGIYDSAVLATFRSARLGVQVESLVQASMNLPGVFVFELRASSTTGVAIEDVHLGLFADWDVVDDAGDTPADDLGGFDEELEMAYVFDADEVQYYGILPIFSRYLYPDSNLSGYTTESDGSEQSLLTALRSAIPPTGVETQRAVVVGQGPYTLPADGTSVVQAFALVAGAEEGELFNQAWFLFSSCWIYGRACSTETTTAAGTYRLATVYPNPVTTTARVGFELPVAEAARVEVFDLLGRRVATLTDDLRVAGGHTVTLDATGLPSGVYLVRLSTPRATLTERITVVR